MRKTALRIYNHELFGPVMAGLFVALLITVFSSKVFAADVVSVPVDAAPPTWLAPVVEFVEGLPYVGPVLLVLLKYLGMVSAVLTLLSAFIQGLLMIPEVMARFAGAPQLADKIKSFSDTVLPYLKWLSMFNVQKK